MLLYPYKRGSHTARELAKRLNINCSKYNVANHPLILNWGNPNIPDWGSPSVKWINHPTKVSNAISKLDTLRILENNEIRTIPYTTDCNKAIEWFNDGLVYCRTLTRSTKAKGLVAASNKDEMIPAPLYTKEIIGNEYRIHIFNGSCIDYQKKMKRNEAQSNDKIKNLDNGWVYTRNNLRTINENIELAMKTIKAMELDFGAVEIIRADYKSYILEVNSAPGLEGTTLDNYVYFIGEYVGKMEHNQQ